jgi:hypothetical protein
VKDSVKVSKILKQEKSMDYARVANTKNGENLIAKTHAQKTA